MMIFFPSAYPDELLFSLCSRYYARSGNISYKRTLDDIFGNRSLTASISLPSGIGALVKNLPNNDNLTIEHFIYKHTLFLYYASFLSAEQATKVYMAMCSNDGKAIYVQAGINASGVEQNEFLRFCKECLREDRQAYGEFYWHRSHQMSGIHCCLKHFTPLYDSSVRVVGSNKHRFVLPTTDNCSSNSSVLNEVSQKTRTEYTSQCMKMAKDILLLMNQPLEHKPLQWFGQKYKNQLAQMDLAYYTGRVHQKGWRDYFQSIYSSDVLELFQSTLKGEGDWLSLIVQKNRKSFHPIRHLLVTSALNMSVEELFCQELTEPFGQPEWPCLNTVCKHYNNLVIKNVSITLCEHSNNPIGTFTCPKCEFSYTRRGPDQVQEDIYRKTRVKTYGTLWQAKLQEFSTLNLSLRELSRRMGADPNTVKRFLGERKIQTEVCTVKDDLYIDRQKWLALKIDYPEKSIIQLRQIEKALYMRLYRKDRGWLKSNSPKPIKRSSSTRIDWNKRDEEILKKVTEIVEGLIIPGKKPVRITIGKVGYLIGKKALLEKNLDKMPKTKAYIEGIKESPHDFRLRRVRQVLNEMNEEGEVIKEWKVLRRSGIKKQFYGEVKDIVQKFIRNLYP